MKRMMTRQKLYEIDNEFKQYADNNHGLHLLIQDKIKRFYEKAAHELKVTAARYKAIQDLYVKKDSNGNFLTEEIDGKQEWKLIDDSESLRLAGIPDVSMVKDAFNDACKKLFDQTISFDW